MREVVTICGSMTLFHHMLTVASEETLAGHVVLAPFSVIAPQDQQTETKTMLDELHLVKIELSNRVIVVTDQDGRIGESTKREISYAGTIGRPITYRRFTLPAPAGVRVAAELGLTGPADRLTLAGHLFETVKAAGLLAPAPGTTGWEFGRPWLAVVDVVVDEVERRSSLTLANRLAASLAMLAVYGIDSETGERAADAVADAIADAVESDIPGFRVNRTETAQGVRRAVRSRHSWVDTVARLVCRALGWTDSSDPTSGDVGPQVDALIAVAERVDQAQDARDGVPVADGESDRGDPCAQSGEIPCSHNAGSEPVITDE